MIQEHPTSSRAFHTETIETDLVIVGGGLAGTCAAITAARAERAWFWCKTGPCWAATLRRKCAFGPWARRRIRKTTIAGRARRRRHQRDSKRKSLSQPRQDFARQDVYEAHVALYEKLGIPFDLLTIDAEWTLTPGDWRVDTQKWPDMKGFIGAQHTEGRRVLLWICPLSAGLPGEERDYSPDSAWGKVNPRNVKWRERLKQRMEEMLGPNGLNADGLKFDYVGPMRGADWSREEAPLHGYSYLFELYRAVSAAAKAVRPDCLLDFQCAHPQFAAFHDMTRLNDFFLPLPQALRVMETRAQIARSATFGALIDTDCPVSRDYLRHSARFGNRSLYLTHEQLENPEIAAILRENP